MSERWRVVPVGIVLLLLTPGTRVDAQNPGSSMAPGTAAGPHLVALTVNPGGVDAGSLAVGAVTLDAPAPAGGIAVALSSNNTAAATVPVSLVVPAETSAVTFLVMTQPSAPGDISVEISAAYDGDTEAASLIVHPAPSTGTTGTTTGTTGVTTGTTGTTTGATTGGTTTSGTTTGTTTSGTTGTTGGGLPVTQASLPPILAPTPQDRIAVFRPSTGEWILRDPNGSETTVAFGAAGDVPLPRDYDGRGRAQIAYYRPSDQSWAIRSDNGSVAMVHWGQPGDIPVPADYLGQGHVQIAVFRPGAGDWIIQGVDGNPLVVPWGEATDIPVPGTYVADARAHIAVYRPRTGQWYIRLWNGKQLRVQAGGLPQDLPAPAVYGEPGLMKSAYYRPVDQTWGVFNLDSSLLLAVKMGEMGDQPVPGDYLGQGHAEPALFRPATGQWMIPGMPAPIQWGQPGDVPLPAPYAPGFLGMTAAAAHQEEPVLQTALLPSSGEGLCLPLPLPPLNGMSCLAPPASIRRAFGSGGQVAELPLAVAGLGGLAVASAGKVRRRAVLRDLFGGGGERDEETATRHIMHPAIHHQVEHLTALGTRFHEHLRMGQVMETGRRRKGLKNKTG